MPQLAEVHTIYETNFRSIPDMLKEAAGNIETEGEEGYSLTTAMVGIQLAENGKVQIYGWGETEIYHMLGLLQRAMHLLLGTLAAEAEQ